MIREWQAYASDMCRPTRQAIWIVDRSTTLCSTWQASLDKLPAYQQIHRGAVHVQTVCSLALLSESWEWVLDMGSRNGHGRRSKRQNLQWLRVHWAILLCKLHLTSFQLINNPSGSRACANTVFLRFFQASAWESRTYTVSETCRVKGPGKRPNVHSKLSIVVLLAKIQ